MKKGDLVASTDSRWPLHCGSGIYPHAVVVSTTPLVLVSESADMRWELTVRPDKLKVIGRAGFWTRLRCRRRLKW
jgi:hypothetical protein